MEWSTESINRGFLRGGIGLFNTIREALTLPDVRVFLCVYKCGCVGCVRLNTPLSGKTLNTPLSGRTSNNPLSSRTLNNPCLAGHWITLSSWTLNCIIPLLSGVTLNCICICLFHGFCYQRVLVPVNWIKQMTMYNGVDTQCRGVVYCRKRAPWFA